MKYIDADKLIKKFEKMIDDIPASVDSGAGYVIDEVYKIIDSLQREQPIKVYRVESQKGLDEAADMYAPDLPSYNIGTGYLPPQSREDLRIAFKDGAEWMAERGVSMEYEVEDKCLELDYGSLPGLDPIINLPDSFKPGDKVVVQIRKKD